MLCVLSDTKQRKNVKLAIFLCARDNAARKDASDFPLNFFLTTLNTLVLMYFSRTRRETLRAEVPIALLRRQRCVGGCYYQALESTSVVLMHFLPSCL